MQYKTHISYGNSHWRQRLAFSHPIRSWAGILAAGAANLSTEETAEICWGDAAAFLDHNGILLPKILGIFEKSHDLEVSIVMGGTTIAGWFTSWKIPNRKWMRSGGSPIFGNLHISGKVLGIQWDSTNNWCYLISTPQIGGIELSALATLNHYKKYV